MGLVFFPYIQRYKASWPRKRQKLGGEAIGGMGSGGGAFAIGAPRRHTLSLFAGLSGGGRRASVGCSRRGSHSLGARLDGSAFATTVRLGLLCLPGELSSQISTCHDTMATLPEGHLSRPGRRPALRRGPQATTTIGGQDPGHGAAAVPVCPRALPVTVRSDEGSWGGQAGWRAAPGTGSRRGAAPDRQPPPPGAERVRANAGRSPARRRTTSVPDE